MSWLERRAPKVHHFLRRRDSPWPAVREVVGGLLVVLLLLGGLWAYTGQPVGDSPVVVVESGSMMHCANGVSRQGDACAYQRFGRFGTIDAGDLVLVKALDGNERLPTRAGGGEHHYGAPGEVIVYRRNGDPAGTPIIHRALFWLEIHGERDYSIPELGLEHIPDLHHPDLLALTGSRGSWAGDVMDHCKMPSQSGYITRGDNNPEPDQGDGGIGIQCPVRTEWIVGKARGEIPWVGLIKLKAAHLAGGGPDNYARAPDDLKTMLFVTVAILVGAPIALEQVQRRRQRAKEDRQQREANAEPPADPDPEGADRPGP